MPIYEYKCCDCGKVTDIIRDVGENDKPACDCCGSQNLLKLPTAASCISSQKTTDAMCNADNCPLSPKKFKIQNSKFKILGDCNCCPDRYD